MRRAFATLLLLCALAPAHGAVHVHAVLSDDAAAYRAVAGALRAGLPAARVSVALADDPVPSGASVVVPVGMRAAATVMTAADARAVFATLVPAAGWRELAADAGERPATALFLDQPLHRHAALVRTLLPPLRELGVVYGPASVARAAELPEEAAAYSLRIHRADAATPDDVNDAVVAVLRNSEALLALPDPTVFNRYTVQAVLLETFRLRRPVVGFSESWVRAGALGAVYSTPEQLGTELAMMIERWLDAGGAPPPARHPEEYTLSVNRQVAFSLGIHLPPDAVLIQQLQALGPAR